MPYSQVSDMVVGDVISNLDRQKFVNEAAEEIDSKIGWVYNLPLEPISPATDLPVHQALLLKQISNKLASGRWIMAAYSAGENTVLHSYGASLVKEARHDLSLIANGTVALDATRLVDETDEDAMVPSLNNHDEESLLLGFENTVMRSQPWYTRPGGALPW